MPQFRITIPTLIAAFSLTSVAHAVSSAEFYSAASYPYGRVEARLQFAAGDGVVSSFFLWKNGSETAGTFWNELDFEKVGADCRLETNPIYGNPAANHSQKQSLTGTLCGEFHNYAYEWTPDYVAWLVDGLEVRRESGATALAFSQNAVAGMQIRFNIWPGDASFGGNFNPAILPLREYIDWVQYSSYANGAFKLEWREDFTAGTLPSGWLAGNWGSPKNLSTHTPANVGFVDGYAVLLLTADDATGSLGPAPADSGGTPVTPTTGGTTSGGGTPKPSGCSLGALRPDGDPGILGRILALLCVVLGAVLGGRKRRAR